jgi:D-alanine-D-alanine ligase
MSRKIRVAVLFGGKSAEHEVSLWSANSVVENLDKTKYEPILIGIDQNGRWLMKDAPRLLAAGAKKKSAEIAGGDSPAALSTATNGSSAELALVPGHDNRSIIDFKTESSSPAIDVIFPVLHGPYGEDGSVQGLLKLANIPYVGPGVLGSAIGMDKDVQKRLLQNAGIPVGRFIAVNRGERKNLSFDKVSKELGMPLFIKPANLGSSVGVSKVHNEAEFGPAIDQAFEWDRKIVIEEFIECREIEVSVLGNEEPIASVPGEILPSHEFYSYEAKYLDEHGAALEIPAKLTDEQTAEIRRLAVETFKTLCCEGMSRVDFFMTKDGKILVNEINTIPGFTNISMYPKLWEATGIPYSELLDRLIQLAIERHEVESGLRVSVK